MAYLPGPNGGRINFSVTTAAGGSTSGVLASVSTGTVYLAGGSNVTLSQTGSTVIISGSGPTLSRYEYPQQIFAPLTTPLQGSMSVEHEYIPFNIVATAAKIGGSLSVGSTSNGSMRTASVSLWMGIYSLNASTLSLYAHGSANNTFQHYGGTTAVSVASNSSIAGMRQLTVPLAYASQTTATQVTIPSGEYWIGAVVSSSAATTNQSFNFTMYGNNQINGQASSAIIAPIGGAVTPGRNVILFQGIVTGNGFTMPSSLASNTVNNQSASFVQWGNYYNAIYGADF